MVARLLVNQLIKVILLLFLVVEVVQVRIPEAPLFLNIKNILNMTQVSEQIRTLFEKVQAKKAEIASAEAGRFVTDGLFKFGSNTRVIDLKTEKNVDALTDIMAFLLEKESYSNVAAKRLGLPTEPFKWMGATVSQWESDLKTRITQLQLTQRRCELKKAEEDLLKISPALLEELRLDAISKLVG